jgi:Pentapeptide repeats (9 copies)
VKVRIHREKPEPWEIKKRDRRRWLLPFWAVDWGLEWCAYALSRWTFLDVLEYLEGFSVLIAVIFYFSESGDRLKQKHYQAWQVINTAQGKGGNGGRIDALEELNSEGISLIGVDLSGAFLQAVHLEHARLSRASFRSADMRDSDFASADFSNADLQSTNLRQSNLRNANFTGSNLRRQTRGRRRGPLRMRFQRRRSYRGNTRECGLDECDPNESSLEGARRYKRSEHFRREERARGISGLGHAARSGGQ